VSRPSQAKGCVNKIRVRVVVDARKAPLDFVRAIAELARVYRGESRCLIELHTSEGVRGLMLHRRVSAGEQFYSAVRSLGWVAVPEPDTPGELGLEPDGEEE
jgi:hypothetical protein